jgi:hypothetical protein
MIFVDFELIIKGGYVRVSAITKSKTTKNEM